MLSMSGDWKAENPCLRSLCALFIFMLVFLPSCFAIMDSVLYHLIGLLFFLKKNHIGFIYRNATVDQEFFACIFLRKKYLRV